MACFKEFMSPDLNIKKAYFIGIKGVGMTSLAQILQSKGICVSGSDVDEKFFTDEVLSKLGVKVFNGFDKKNIPFDADLFISSAAYLNESVDNIEISELKKRNLPIFTYPQVVGALFRDKFGLAVAGTHGKSTTTAMLGFVLEQVGLDPEVIVGTRIAQWGCNARPGKSKYLVVEADEYRDAFSNYNPRGLILTSIEYDHPDFYHSPEEYEDAFKRLVSRIPENGFIVANKKDEAVKRVVRFAKCPVFEYEAIDELDLMVLGEHNKSNASAVIVAAEQLGIDRSRSMEALSKFKGISRRLEVKKIKDGVVFIDDYAHHPSEIKASISAISGRYAKRRIWLVFQPHTFSRTKALLNDFARSFSGVDLAIVTDIYASAREKSGQISSDDLVKEAQKFNQNVLHIRTLEEVASFLKSKIGRNDVIVAMGAGDVWRVLDMI